MVNEDSNMCIIFCAKKKKNKRYYEHLLYLSMKKLQKWDDVESAASVVPLVLSRTYTHIHE